MTKLFNRDNSELPFSIQNSKIKLFLKLLYLEKINISSIIYLSIGINILFFTVPIGIQILVNHFSLMIYQQPTAFILIVIFFLLSLAAVMKSTQLMLVERLQRRFFSDLALEYDQMINNAPEDCPSLITKINKFFEVVTLQKTFSGLIVQAIALLLQITLGTIIIAFYHPFLIIYSLLLLLSLYLVFFVFGKGSVAASIDESNKKYKVIEWLQELPAAKNKLNDPKANTSIELIEKYLNSRENRFKIIFRQSNLLLAIYVIASVCLLSIGGYLVVNQKMTLGQLVAAELIISSILQSLFKFADLLDYWFDTYTSLEKINNVFPSSESTKQTYAPKPSSNIIFLIEDKLKWINFSKLTGVSILFIALLMLFMPWMQIISGQGKVIALDAQERRQELSAPIDGRIIKWNFNEGDKVKKGDLIVELSDSDPQILERIESERNAIVKKFESLELARKTSALNVDRQKELYNQGLSSKRALELSKMELAKLESEEASALADMSRIDVKLSRQEQQNVIAPIDGFLVRILTPANGGSQFVHTGDPLAILVPDTNSRAVETWIRGNDLPWIRKGATASIQFEGWPAIQFSGLPNLAVGTFQAIVKTVDAIDDGYGNFRIVLVPKIESDWPSNDFLRQGVRAITWINIGQVSLGYELWRQFNGFPPSALNKEFIMQKSENKIKNKKDGSEKK